jgi:tetratricopeptide (TPR) repeat protein
MSFFYRMLVIAFILNSFSSQAQQNFKQELREANPVKSNSTLSIEKVTTKHEEYLAKAISEKNVTQHFYGLLYLFLDHYKMHDYVGVSKYLLQAENLANENGDPGWQAAILLRKALMADNINNDSKEALKDYEMALKFCIDAKDSLCMGETLEQISAMYGQLEEYEHANNYYKLALPILEKYADRQEMALSYNNYSNLLCYQKKYSASRQYIDSAISLARLNKDPYKEMMYLNNKGSLLSDMGQYDLAINIYKNCVLVVYFAARKRVLNKEKR